MMCKTALTLYPEGRQKVGRPKQHGGGPLSKNEQNLVGIVGRWHEQICCIWMHQSISQSGNGINA